MPENGFAADCQSVLGRGFATTGHVAFQIDFSGRHAQGAGVTVDLCFEFGKMFCG